MKEFLSFPDQFRIGEEAENAAAKKALGKLFYLFLLKKIIKKNIFLI